MPGKRKNNEFEPDNRHEEKETQLPIVGSEFPGLPIEATEKPKQFFGNKEKGYSPDIDGFDDRKTPSYDQG